jgi:arylsulfatase A-like enzyme
MTRQTANLRLSSRYLLGLLLILLAGISVALSYSIDDQPQLQGILQGVALLIVVSYSILLSVLCKAKSSQANDLVIMSAVFGIIAGLIEGLYFWVSSRLGTLNGISIEILWISPAVNLLIFGGIGLLLALVSIFLPRNGYDSIVIFIFLFLTLMDWFILVTSGKIHVLASLMLTAGISIALLRWIRKFKIDYSLLGRKWLPRVLAAFFVLFLSIQSATWLIERGKVANLPEASEDLPNIIFIVIDALRSDHLSTYGYARQTSPYIDKLAAQGVVFDNAFSSTSYTLPSHVSMLTGLYPREHGVEWDTYNRLATNGLPMLSEALTQEGYRTGGFSGNTFWFTREQGFGRGFSHFEDFFTTLADMALRTFYGRGFELYIMRKIGLDDIPARKHASDINHSVVKWITQDADRPFFVFINFMDVHDPYLPALPYRTQFSDQDGIGGILNWRVGRTDPKLSPAELQSEIDAYDGAIAYTDHQIQLLLEQLQADGYLENTLIVLTSDHGEAFGEHDLYLHAHSLYREVIEIPLILHWAGELPAGKRISQPVSNVFLPATILDLIGSKAKDDIPGKSLARLWRENSPDSQWPLPLSELARQPWVPETYPVYHGWIKSVISSEWHLIQHETLDLEMFRWKIDPRESSNRAMDATSKEELRLLIACIKNLRTC